MSSRKGNKLSLLERILSYNRDAESEDESSDSDEECAFYEEDRVNLNYMEYDEEQQRMVRDLVKILTSDKKRMSTANFSHTGFGKTPVAFYLAQALDVNIIIFCPANSVMTWINHSQVMKYSHRVSLISSLGLASNNKEYDLEYTLRNKKVTNSVHSGFCDIKKPCGEAKEYVWDDRKCRKVFSNSIVVIDESHKITTGSAVSRYFLELYKYLTAVDHKGRSKFELWNCYWYMQSATIAEKKDRYRRILFMLGILDDESKGTFGRFLSKCKEEANDSGIYGQDDATLLRRYMKSGKIPYVVSAKPPKYPFRNEIRAELFRLDEKTTLKIEEANKEIAAMIKSASTGSGGGFAAIQKRRRKIEAWMIPLYVSLCKALVEKGYAVAIFMSFLDTISELEYQLRKYKPTVITGEVSDKSLRDSYQRRFREGKIKVMILSVGVGSTSISLHDTVSREDKEANPNLRRAHASLLSLTYCMVDFIQMLGRLYRRGLKSDVLQILPLVKDTSHEEIASSIISKMSVIEKFNDDVPRSVTIYEAINGSERDIKYSDIDDTEDLSEVINNMIPDITEETLREKDNMEIVPINNSKVTLPPRDVPVLTTVTTAPHTVTTILATTNTNVSDIHKTGCPLTAKQISGNEYHVSGQTLKYKDIIKPISHKWNGDLHVWVLDTKEYKQLSRVLRDKNINMNTILKEVEKKSTKKRTATLVTIQKKSDGTVIVGCDLYIGRRITRGVWDLERSKWASPYKVGEDYTLQESLKLYREHIIESGLIHDIQELDGLVLGCFCRPISGHEMYCHGQVLIDLLENS